MKITVLVPTYRRPHYLARCLKGLTKQKRLPDEVLVIVQEVDTETLSFLETLQLDNFSYQLVKIDRPGQVAALNLGIESSSGDIIAITDDDAVPRPHWLELIEAHFLADESVGGVGGRDWQRTETEILTENSTTVGQVQWHGEIIGRHNMAG